MRARRCRLDAAISALSGKAAAVTDQGSTDPVQAAAAGLLPELRTLSRLLLAHLRSEEDHMQPIAKRYLPMELTKQLMAQVSRC
jgi:hypothetical protein